MPRTTLTLPNTEKKQSTLKRKSDNFNFRRPKEENKLKKSVKNGICRTTLYSSTFCRVLERDKQKWVSERERETEGETKERSLRYNFEQLQWSLSEFLIWGFWQTGMENRVYNNFRVCSSTEEIFFFLKSILCSWWCEFVGRYYHQYNFRFCLWKESDDCF